MDQNKIIEGLQKALANGTGDLDDLDALLVKAREDIEATKKAEAEAKAAAEAKAKKDREEAERGQRIAQMATRMINGELSNADVAMVLNQAFKQADMPEVWTGESVHELLQQCKDTEPTKKVEKPVLKKERVNEAVDALDELAKALADLFHIDTKDIKGAKINVRENGKPAKDPDAVINKFLKDFGLA